MTREEAANVVRQKWADNDGCRSCGRKPAMYELEPIENSLDPAVIDQGFVEFLCSGDDGTELHRGIRVYLK